MLRTSAWTIGLLSFTLACGDGLVDTRRAEGPGRPTELAGPGSSDNADQTHGSKGQPKPPAADPSQSDSPAQSERPDDKINFAQLEAGLYWFGKGGRYQKADPKLSSTYYDPTKPTFIYVHGWQFNSIAVNFHESTLRPVVSGEPVDLAKAWIEQGWNVGIFLWTQFADDELLTAERKIWDGSNMTWLSNDGVRHPFPSKLSASDLFHQAYREALRMQQNPEIRIAGHSLGSQMATILSKRLSDDAEAGRIRKELVPKRLILMDPFMSNGAKDYLQGQLNSAVMVNYAKDFIAKSGISLEIYRTSLLSLLPQADAHPELIALSAFRNVGNDGLFKPEDQAGKHGYAVAYYFWSMAFSSYPAAPAAPEADPALPKTCISARSTVSELQALMRSKLQQKTLDNMTREPNDDPCSWQAKGAL